MAPGLQSDNGETQEEIDKKVEADTVVEVSEYEPGDDRQARE